MVCLYPHPSQNRNRNRIFHFRQLRDVLSPGPTGFNCYTACGCLVFDPDPDFDFDKTKIL